MTKYQLKRRAVRIFRQFEVPKHVQRHYQQQWLRCVESLGERWLLARPVQKGADHDRH